MFTYTSLAMRVKKFGNSVAKSKSDINALNVQKRNVTHSIIAEGYKLAQYCLSREGRPEYTELLADNKITREKPGENKFLPVVRLLWFGQKSAEKYAGVLRYLEDTGIDPATAANHIANYRSYVATATTDGLRRLTDSANILPSTH